MANSGLKPRELWPSIAVGGIAIGASALVSYTIWKWMKRRKIESQPLFEINGSVNVIDTSEEWEEVCETVTKDIQIIKVLGLDCEWVQKRPVALLQLATPKGECVLVRLFKLGSAIPQSLRSILADKSILKVGVAVTDDARRLFIDYGIEVNGCVDLRHVLKRIRGVFHCPSRGLKGLASGVLGVEIGKDFDIRCGNWEAEQYSKKQIEYAATDAAVAVDIFIQLVYAKLCSSLLVEKKESITATKAASLDHINKQKDSHSSPSLTPDCNQSVVNDGKELNDDISLSDKDRKDVSEAINSNSSMKRQNSFVPETQSFQSIRSPNAVKKYKFEDVCCIQTSSNIDASVPRLQEFWKTARSLCQGIVGATYKSFGDNKLRIVPPKFNGKLKDTAAYSVRQRPLWDNCRLEAPDGVMLCTCDTRKAQWYLDKQLGDKICDDPLTVRLHFEPARRPKEEMNFYKQEKKNICVVCGHDQDYVRKFVIPFEYRKYLPNALKDHSSHDVLLLCTACHRRSCDSDAQLRLRLAEECNAPVESGPAAKVTLDHGMQKIRSAGRALKLNKDSIPSDRVVKLEEVLCEYFGVDTLSDDLIEQAAEVDARHMSADYVPHAKRVVQHMRSNGGLLAFQARWRQHFLDTMNPQYLPAFWSVDFVPEGWMYEQEQA